MIYLIDDKRDRQERDYYWTSERFLKFKNNIKPIYSLRQINDENLRDCLFSEGSIIFLHESFFDNSDNKLEKDSTKIRTELRNKALQRNIWLVYFSGSKNSRTIDDRIAHVPVSTLYKNLEIFIENKIKNQIDLNYILFGNNPKIESYLLDKLEKFNNDFELIEIQTNSKSLIFHIEGRQNIPLKLSNSVVEKLIFENRHEGQITDEDLNNLLVDVMAIHDYENLFIPLCFGPTLSDYNGLRLATHIRCTPTKNQLKPIFIYGFVNHSYLIDNEYFDILKTKNVFLIPYTRNGFSEALNRPLSDFTLELLPAEIQKLNLKVPSNYEDNHSIANEWAIYRWSQILGATNNNIERINELQNSNLYFKYLKTICPVSHVDIIKDEHLKIHHQGNPRILYVDDEAEKGWRKIFEAIFYDKNENIDFSYLDNELIDKTPDEICELVLNTIIDEKIDLVILDFRLHQFDFNKYDVKKVTGYRILEKIKNYNKGIQVIIFSATNKIWNLQALQEAGADGFIIKESPENSIDSDFTRHSLLNLIKTIEDRLKMIFLNKVFIFLQNIKFHLNQISNNNGGAGLEEGLMKVKFKNEIFIQLGIIYDCLENSSSKKNREFVDEHSYLNLSFISIFKIIELINDFYTDNRGLKLKSNNQPIQRYIQNNNSFSSLVNNYPTTKDKIYSIIKHELKDEPNLYVNSLNKFINYRNKITHPETLRDYKKTTKQDNIDFIQLITELIQKIA